LLVVRHGWLRVRDLKRGTGDFIKQIPRENPL
jgi:hypothetical protein